VAYSRKYPTLDLLYAPPWRHVTSCCLQRSQSAACIDRPLGGGDTLTPAWAQRQKPWWRDGVVSPDGCHHRVDRLGAFGAPSPQALAPAASPRHRPGPDQGLVGPRRPREAPEPDARARALSDRTPPAGATSAGPAPALGALARVSKAGAGREASGPRGQGAGGLAAYPGRP
jgi:hypothetical protein